MAVRNSTCCAAKESDDCFAMVTFRTQALAALEAGRLHSVPLGGEEFRFAESS